MVPSTLTVTNNLDTGVAGDGSLRGEIAAAQSGDTINFAPSLASQTITLTQGELAINKSLDIEGLGANQLTISGGGNSRVFDITASTASVTLAGLTISDGRNSYGGGINNVGTLTVNYCTLSGNVVFAYADGSNEGGAIDNFGTLSINNSTISGNKAVGPPGYGVSMPGSTPSGGSVIYLYVSGGTGQGGGLYVAGGTVSINNSTFADNEALGGSGGFYVPTAGSGEGGGMYIAGGAVSVNNSTFAGNQAVAGNAYPMSVPGYGGGIYNSISPAALTMHDTILANNTASADPDLAGAVTSLGHNLIGNSTGGYGYAASDLLNVNPQLGPLQNYGGPTQTMALLAGSRAINAGDNTGAPAYDQRGPGFARIVGGVIDIGAYEVQNGGTNQASSLTVSGFPSVTTAGNAGSFTVTAKNADGSVDTGYTGTVHFTSSDAQAGLPADYTFTVADQGVHTFSATLKTAGTQSITAADTATASLTGTDGGITVDPAAARKFVLIAPASVNPSVPFSLTVKVEDAYGNVVVGYTGTIHFSSTDNKATLPANCTFTASDNGVHTFTGLVLRKRGNQKITVSDTHNSALTGSTIVDVL